MNTLDEAVHRLNDQLAARLAELLGCAVRLDTERVLTEGDGEAPSRTTLTVDMTLHLEAAAARRLTVRRSLPAALVDALASAMVAGLSTELRRGSVAVVEEVNRLRGAERRGARQGASRVTINEDGRARPSRFFTYFVNVCKRHTYKNNVVTEVLITTKPPNKRKPQAVNFIYFF